MCVMMEDGDSYNACFAFILGVFPYFLSYCESSPFYPSIHCSLADFVLMRIEYSGSGNTVTFCIEYMSRNI